MLLELHPVNPSERKLGMAISILKDDGVIVYPTDTVYAIACALDSKAGFARICRIRNIQPKEAAFSMIAADMAQASPFLAQLDNPTFRILNRHLPGPYTFILQSSRKMPSHVRSGRDTIGLRIPAHTVSLAIVRALDMPLLTTSLKTDDDLVEYLLDPDEIHEEYKKLVDCVVDSGRGDFTPSTVVSLLDKEPEIIRQGKGEVIY